MSGESAKSLVEFLQGEAGEYLRSAIHYDETDYEVLYLRDDVDTQYDEGRFDAMFEFFRGEKTDTTEHLFELGNQHCTMRLYDEGVLFHFAQGDDVGTIVSLDPEAGRDVVTFVTRCLQQLHENSPQTIEAAPEWLRS